MSRPKTKDAVNFLVKVASDLLNNKGAGCVENFMYLFTCEYVKIGKRYPTKVMGRMTYIVPDQISEVHEKILEIVRIYFSDISGLDFVADRKTIISHRAEAKKKLQELKL